MEAYKDCCYAPHYAKSHLDIAGKPKFRSYEDSLVELEYGELDERTRGLREEQIGPSYLQ